jgi:hypothetical protein
MPSAVRRSSRARRRRPSSIARGKQSGQLHQEQCGRVEFWQPEQQQRLPGVCAMRTPSDRGENLWFAGLLSESDNMASVVKALCGAH